MYRITLKKNQKKNYDLNEKTVSCYPDVVDCDPSLVIYGLNILSVNSTENLKWCIKFKKRFFKFCSFCAKLKEKLKTLNFLNNRATRLVILL